MKSDRALSYSFLLRSTGCPVAKDKLAIFKALRILMCVCVVCCDGPFFRIYDVMEHRSHTLLVVDGRCWCCGPC